MTVTIDAAGRLVIPKAIRDEAEIEPGMPLEISVNDGVIEIAPRASGVRLVRQGRWLVAEPLEPGPPLTTADTTRAIARSRNERMRSILGKRGR
jgi:AbrB family looped-hinge helix DNA binding protein